MKTMFDCAFLPSPAPSGYDVAAGYVYQAHNEAANIWSYGDWHRAAAASRWLLPIATCWAPFGDAANDADLALVAWQTVCRELGMKWVPSAFALDVEQSQAAGAHAAGYIDRWRAEMRAHGCVDVVYSSRSTAPLLGTGPRWVAFGALGGDVVIVQTGQSADHSIDLDAAADAVPFFDTRGAPPQPKGHKMFALFTIPDAPTPHLAAAVWVLDGVVRRWVTNHDELAALQYMAGVQGLPFAIGTMTMAQCHAIPVVGPVP